MKKLHNFILNIDFSVSCVRLSFLRIFVVVSCVKMAPSKRSAKSKHEHHSKQKRINERERQLKAAVQYCINNNCRGSKAITAGLCSMIKSRLTINKRLDGSVNTGNKKEYRQILYLLNTWSWKVKLYNQQREKIWMMLSWKC